MNYVFFFFRNSLKKPIIYLAAAGFVIMSFFAFSANSLKETLPCAVCSLDDSEDAKEVALYLKGKGMSIECESEEEVNELIRDGKADMGLLIHEDFSEKLNKLDPKNSVTLIVSDRTENLYTFKLIAAMAIFRQYLPYMTADSLSRYGYQADKEEVEAHIDEVKDYVTPLGFDIISIRGNDLAAETDYNLSVGIIALTVFAVMGFLCTGFLRRTGREVRIRFKSESAFFFKCILPQCASMGMITFVAAGAGCLLGSLFFTVPVVKILISLFLYIFVLVWLFAFIDMLPLSDYLLVCIIAVDAAISLVLCPLYAGTTLLSAYITPLRAVSIPYLLFLLFGIF